MSRDIYITSGCSYSDPDFVTVDADYTVDYDMWMTVLRKKLGIEHFALPSCNSLMVLRYA